MQQIWDKRNELCVYIKYYVVSGISTTARTDLAGIFFGPNVETDFTFI